MARSIQGLPGWVWIYDGEEEWTTSQGKQSTVRHGKELLTGEVKSVRQIRNLQIELRPANILPFKRKNVTETRFYTRRSQTERGKQIVTYVFRSLEEAQSFVENSGIPSDYSRFIVQSRFASSRMPGKEYVSYSKNNKKRKEKYATLSQYFFNDQSITSEDWNAIYTKALEFNYNKDSRFYVFAIE